MDDAESIICSVVTFFRSFCNVSRSGKSSVGFSVSSYNISNFCSRDRSRNSFTDSIELVTARFVAVAAGVDAIMLDVIVPMSGSTTAPVFLVVAAAEDAITSSSLISKSGNSLIRPFSVVVDLSVSLALLSSEASFLRRRFLPVGLVEYNRVPPAGLRPRIGCNTSWNG